MERSCLFALLFFPTSRRSSHVALDFYGCFRCRSDDAHRDCESQETLMYSTLKEDCTPFEENALQELLEHHGRRDGSRTFFVGVANARAVLHAFEFFDWCSGEYCAFWPDREPMQDGLAFQRRLFKAACSCYFDHARGIFCDIATGKPLRLSLAAWLPPAPGFGKFCNRSLEHKRKLLRARRPSQRRARLTERLFCPPA